MAAFDKTYRLVLRVGETFYHLAGLERMAKHLRFKTGRPSEQKKGGPKDPPGVA